MHLVLDDALRTSAFAGYTELVKAWTFSAGTEADARRLLKNAEQVASAAQHALTARIREIYRSFGVTTS